MPTVGVRHWTDWSVDVRVVTADSAAIADAATICRAEMAAVSQAVNRFQPDSELSRITGHTSRGVRISPALTKLIRVGIQAARQTGGAVDPTIGSDLRRLGYTVDLGSIDPNGSLGASETRHSWKEIRLSGNLLTLPDDIQLDFGATAKAFAADRAARRVADETGVGVLVSLGGDLSCAGDEPIGGWRIQVQDAPGEPVQQIVLRGTGGVATSSRLHRIWHRDGQTFSHILDPRTGLPVAPVWRTVSVRSPHCVTANMWSTAAFVWGRDAITRLASVPARFVDAEGVETCTEAWHTR